MRDAVEALSLYVDELFEEGAAEAVDALPSRAAIRPKWIATIKRIFDEAGLEMSEVPYPQSGGRDGRHGEGLGHLLAEMQSVYRAHPGATW